jgi:hypothetical protein
MNMKRSISVMAAILLAGSSVCIGCGGDREERGIDTVVEEAVPMDPKEMEMTEAERKAKAAKDEAEAEMNARDEEN